MLDVYYGEFMIPYRELVKYVSTRWLSLHAAVERTLKQYQGLYSYIMSEANLTVGKLPNDMIDHLVHCYILFV